MNHRRLGTFLITVALTFPGQGFAEQGEKVFVVKCLGARAVKAGVFVVHYISGAMATIAQFPVMVAAELERQSKLPYASVPSRSPNLTHKRTMEDYEAVATRLENWGCSPRAIREIAPNADQQLILDQQPQEELPPAD